MTNKIAQNSPLSGRAARALVLVMITATAAAALVAIGAARTPQTAAAPTALYVNPVTGSDTASGNSASPFRTIQRAMHTVGPGTTVHLAAGTYVQNVSTEVNGTPSARITIEGPPSGIARLFGTTHVMAIKNSYYTLQGFSIDGQQAVEAKERVTQWPGTAAGVAAFKSSVASIAVNDRLIYIDSGSSTAGVTGTIINKMILTGAGGECVRIRNKATANVIENTVIRYCGMFPVVQAGLFTYHNGEGIYIGTSPKSTTLANYKDDTSNGNLLSHDTITTWGSECMDIKENAHNNVLHDSTCADNLEPLQYTGSTVELRGYDNTIEGSVIKDSAAYGVKIASDTTAQDIGGNIFTGDYFSVLSGGALYDTSVAPAGQACGNVIGTGAVPGNFSRLTGYAKACPAS